MAKRAIQVAILSHLEFYFQSGLGLIAQGFIKSHIIVSGLRAQFSQLEAQGRAEAAAFYAFSPGQAEAIGIPKESPGFMIGPAGAVSWSCWTP